MLVLGLSPFDHNASVVLMDASGPVAAIEEEKIARESTVAGLPNAAIEYCLREAGARIGDVSLVALAGRPKRLWAREGQFRLSLLPGRAAMTLGSVLARGTRELGHVRMLHELVPDAGRFVNFEHHLCHAASAYFASRFDRALVLTLDGAGDMWSGLLSVGEGADIAPLHAVRFPNSLGWLYARVTELLGFRAGRDEHKVQWLSTVGEPAYREVFSRVFGKDERSLPALNRQYLGAELGGAWRLSPHLLRELKLGESVPPADTIVRAAVARSLQEFVEETVVEILERYRKVTRTDVLCLAGGLFLNVLLVRAIEDRTGFKQIFVQPAAGNAGTALGAAYLGRRRLTGTSNREPLAHVFLGPEFDAQNIKAVLDNCKVSYGYHPVEDHLLAETQRLLLQHKTIAWHQGRTEFGLRALGNRSILASPFSPYVIANLNQYIKHREDFHPFVLSVPAERATDFFDCSQNCRFATSVGRLRNGAPDLERFAFSGRRVRLHVVDRQTNPRFWRLLEAFGRAAPAPILVNTSFNLFGEPLVSSPREAMRTFYCAGIDALVIGDFVVVK